MSKWILLFVIGIMFESTGLEKIDKNRLSPETETGQFL